MGGEPHEGCGHVTDRGVRTEEVGKGEGEVWLSEMNLRFLGETDCIWWFFGLSFWRAGGMRRFYTLCLAVIEDPSLCNAVSDVFVKP